MKTTRLVVNKDAKGMKKKGGSDTPLVSEEQGGGESTRGVGMSWSSEAPGERDQIYGAGGEQDGTAASIVNTTANRMMEDEAALYGQGERTIDENKYARSHANANTEFNFSQYKTGAERLMSGARPRAVSPLEEAGLAGGDLLLKVDPKSKTIDTTMQALSGIYGGIYKQRNERSQAFGDGAVTNPMAPNPFLMTKSMDLTDGGDNEERAGMNDPAEEEEEYYETTAPYEDPSHVKRVAMDSQNGLRRVNMKTSQSTLVQRGAKKEEMEDAYNEANSQYARVLREYSDHAYLTQKQRKENLDILRNPTSRFQASQVGVGDLSRKTAKGYRSKRKNSQASKLGGQLVGV